MHVGVRGKGNKLRHVPLHPGSQELLADYLQGKTRKTLSLFRPVKNPQGGLDQAMTTDGIYKLVRGYAKKLGLEIGVHSLRATAATNALEHEAKISKAQEWLWHANIATTSPPGKGLLGRKSMRCLELDFVLSLRYRNALMAGVFYPRFVLVPSREHFAPGAINTPAVASFAADTIVPEFFTASAFSRFYTQRCA